MKWNSNNKAPISKLINQFRYLSVADPGFPIGGRRPRRGDVDSQGGYVLKILYVETEESGPLEGGGPAPV